MRKMLFVLVLGVAGCQQTAMNDLAPVERSSFAAQLSGYRQYCSDILVRDALFAQSRAMSTCDCIVNRYTERMTRDELRAMAHIFSKPVDEKAPISTIADDPAARPAIGGMERLKAQVERACQ